MSSKKSGFDGRVQFTLRLEPELHAKLVEKAGLAPLNAYIVQVLEHHATGVEALHAAQIFEDMAVKERREAEIKLGRAEDLLKAQPKSMAEAFEAGRESAVSEFKLFLRETIADSVEAAFERRDADEALRETLRKGSKL